MTPPDALPQHDTSPQDADGDAAPDTLPDTLPNTLPDTLPDTGSNTRGLFFRVFPSIILPMFLAAIDQTIVATALPQIAGSLGDVERVGWVVIAYLMATTIAAPVYGRLGDALGRKRLLFVALGLFVAASVACALAPTLLLLIAARVAHPQRR